MSDQDSPPSLFNNSVHPVTLKFQDVEYTIKIKKQGCSLWNNTKNKNNKSEEKKTILKGITGTALPGELVAMLGPSGSGKTTLLTALGGRLPGGKLGGTISYNGKPFSSTMKRNTGFVTQDDVLYPHLTVTETLVFTALLRLPNSFTTQEKIMQAESMISQLGLTRCKNSIIGNHFVRGVSGGERKRVCIGQEMLINPSLLLLDEPTSGLDSTTALKIVLNLSELAIRGRRTVVMTIHQPSSRLFYMFHKVLFLSEGNPLYFGKAAEVMDYFCLLGFSPTIAMNPADYFLDLANGISSDDSAEDPTEITQKLVSAYKANLAENLKAEVKEIDNHPNIVTEHKKPEHWSTTWWQQFTILLQRGVKERRYQSFSSERIAQVITISFLCGLLWFRSDTSHLQDQAGLLFFYSNFWGMFPLFQAIFTFPQERKMLGKERSSAMYRISSYFMSKTIGDLPMELALPTAFCIITYWMGGLKHSFASFVYALFTLLLSVLVSQSLGLAIGALVMDQKSATILGSVIMLSFSLAGSFLVQNVPSFISWIKYISINHHLYKLLLGSQYKHGQTYHCASGTCLVEDFLTIKTVGLNGLAMSVVALAVMLLFYRLVAYFALMRIGVTKK